VQTINQQSVHDSGEPLAAGQNPAATTVVLHRPRHLFSAEVVKAADGPGVSCVIKRVPSSPVNPLRRALIRLFLRREGDILQRIAREAPGVAPAVIGSGPDSLSLELLPGTNFHVLRDELHHHPELLRRLEQAVHRLHQGGFAHGEIRLGNLMAAAEGVFLIDFATAVSSKQLLFPVVRILDLFAVCRIKEQLFALAPERRELELRRRHPALYRLFDRLLGRLILFG